MKTVIDAVNYFKAFLEPASLTNPDAPYLFKEIKDGTYWLSSAKISSSNYGSEIEYICTVDEFNACVDELSAATWIDGVSIEEWKDGIKNTVIDSHGNELEIGKVYEFSNDKIDWYVAKFKNVSDCGGEYLTERLGWKLFIRECQLQLGAIKKAPVKLVDGKAYQFESVATGRVWVGFYNSTNDRFDESVGGDGSHCFIGDASDFKNIIPLVPEIK